MRAVSEVGSDDLVEIILHYEGASFGFASKNFYAEFLAALQVVRESEEHFPGLEYHPPLFLEEVALHRPVPLASLLKPVGVSRQQFLEWNPALSPKLGEVPKGYKVKVPVERFPSLRDFISRLLGRPTIKPAGRGVRERLAWMHHRVVKGETLGIIARRYKIPVAQIQKANALSGHRIVAGELLKIPR
jgi:membrane-bound lytic murein transglycosylase D